MKESVATAALLESALQDDRASMEKFIADLVRLPSENPPGNYYRECRDFVAEQFRQCGLEPVIHTLQTPGHEPAYAVQAFVGPAGPAVYFHGHFDVVPAFTSEQFTPVVRNGNMFGRGTADMKGGLALMLYAAKAIKTCEIPLRGRIGLLFVPDEETGGARGSSILAQQGVLGKDGVAMLTAEPTSGVVWNASRGALSLKITLRGKSFHVGQHYRGINAFEAMVELSNRLLMYKTKIEERNTNFSIDPDAARSSIILIGGTVAGGTNFNTVPDSCSFTIDRRTNPEESLEAEETELLEIVQQPLSSGATVEIETLQRAASSASASDSIPARKLAKNATLVLEKEPKFELCPALLETRFYAQRGIPAFAYGPGLLSVAHGPNEYVNLKKVEEFALIYALTACDILSAE